MDVDHKRQVTKLSLHSSELGFSHPLTHRRDCIPGPPPLWFLGGTHSLAGEGVGVQNIPTRGQTLWYSRYIQYVLCDEDQLLDYCVHGVILIHCHTMVIYLPF